MNHALCSTVCTRKTAACVLRHVRSMHLIASPYHMFTQPSSGILATHWPITSKSAWPTLLPINMYGPQMHSQSQASLHGPLCCPSSCTVLRCTPFPQTLTPLSFPILFPHSLTLLPYPNPLPHSSYTVEKKMTMPLWHPYCSVSAFV